MTLVAAFREFRTAPRGRCGVAGVPDLPPAAAAALSAELVVLAAADRMRAPDPEWAVEAVRAAVGS